MPESYPVVYRDIRRALVRRFPYVIYYRIVSSRVILTLEADGEIRLVTLSQQRQKLRGIFKDVAPDVSLADELIQDRRREAQAETSSRSINLNCYGTNHPIDRTRSVRYCRRLT